MSDVICFGELLIDFVATEPGMTLAQSPIFKKAPGGAPANVAVGLARLGVSSTFMGKVGDDPFGHFLAETLKENRVDISSIVFSTTARTALAFVSLQADGERDFMFYRHPSADMLFTAEEVDEQAIQAGSIFHFGSITLIDDPVRSATLHALEIAKEANLLISYDPNLRLNLWSDAEAAREGILLGWSYAQVIKVSDEELFFLTQIDDFEEAARSLWHDQLRLLVITQGQAGCYYFTSERSGQVSGFDVKVVDTTGAGDGFVAGLLKHLIENKNLHTDSIALENALHYANAVGALTTTKHGAIPALPQIHHIKELLNQRE